MKELSAKQKDSLIKTLRIRFENNEHRHRGIKWNEIESRLLLQPDKLWSLNEMELSGGEPDLILFKTKQTTYSYIDCSAESPIGRRSLCYDQKALDSRKANKPKNSVCKIASQMGIKLLDEDQYRFLQSVENFDTKTSSWLKTPIEIRNLGGAIFGDFRFGRVFIYHNGAESYYAARGFRGVLYL